MVCFLLLLLLQNAPSAELIIKRKLAHTQREREYVA